MQTASKTPQVNPRDVIADPEPYSNLPTLYAEAWATLKRARGQTVDFDRIGPARHSITRPTPDPEPTVVEIMDRCAGQAHRIAVAKGYIADETGDAA